MVTQYRSANTLFWQVSVDHNTSVQYRKGMLQTEGGCFCQPISWSMAAILGDSVVAIPVAVVLKRTQAVPLAVITMRKSTHGFPFLSYMGMGFHLVGLWAAKAPLKNTVIINNDNRTEVSNSVCNHMSDNKIAQSESDLLIVSMITDWSGSHSVLLRINHNNYNLQQK